MGNLQPFTKHFSNGQTARAVKTAMHASPDVVARLLQLPPAKSVLMVFGGAAKMSATVSRQMKTFFATLAGTLTRLQTTVIDGGTDSGVMKLLGSALHDAGLTAPYIGVLPAHTKLEDGKRTAMDILEPHHTHFILIDENRWGREVKLMEALASYLAQDAPSLALLVNGGEIAYQEVLQSIRSGREVLVLKGSGRLADEIAAALTSPAKTLDNRFTALQQSGRLTIFDVNEPPEKLSALLTNRLNRG